MQLLGCRNFIKITSVEKKKFYTGFQQATRLSFTGFSSHWKYQLGVSGGLTAHHLPVGVRVCHYQTQTMEKFTKISHLLKLVMNVKKLMK